MFDLMRDVRHAARRLTRTPMFTAATVIVLLIACANIANLLLVRTEGRAQELRGGTEGDARGHPPRSVGRERGLPVLRERSLHVSPSTYPKTSPAAGDRAGCVL